MTLTLQLGGWAERRRVAKQPQPVAPGREKPLEQGPAAPCLLETGTPLQRSQIHLLSARWPGKAMPWRHQARIIANRERKHPCQTLAHNLHTAMALNNNLEFLWHKSLQELQEIWSRREWSVRRTLDIWRAQNKATRLGVYVPENISRDGLIDLLKYFSKECLLKTSPSSRPRMAGAEMGLYTTSHTGQYKTSTADHELRTGYNTRTSTWTLTSTYLNLEK